MAKRKSNFISVLNGEGSRKLTFVCNVTLGEKPKKRQDHKLKMSAQKQGMWGVNVTLLSRAEYTKL